MLISLTSSHFTMYIKALCYTPYKQTIFIFKKERHVGIFWGERDMFIILLIIMVLWVYANTKLLKVCMLNMSNLSFKKDFLSHIKYVQSQNLNWEFSTFAIKC